jgi:hypothetical protein
MLYKTLTLNLTQDVVKYFFLQKGDKSLILINKNSDIFLFYSTLNSFINFNNFELFFCSTLFKQELFRLKYLLCNSKKNLTYLFFGSIKLIGVGYQFIASLSGAYLFIAVGLTHFIISRYSFKTKTFALTKKKTILTLVSKVPSLKNECITLAKHAFVNIFSGKGAKIVNAKTFKKLGKRTVR